MDRVLHRLRAETGTTLIEVIVAAVILVVIAGSVTSMIGAAQRSSGDSRTMAIAADLAQAELEQLRARKFADLGAVNETVPDHTVGGIKFDITRTSAWTKDDGSAIDCAQSGSLPDALRLSVAVTWKGMNRKPVQLDTLVAAPVGVREGQGVLVVVIRDREAVGLPAVPVTLSGAASRSANTDANGCIRFSELPEGDYTIAFSKTNYVDIKHRNAISDVVTVSENQVVNKTYDYDLGGRAHVQYFQKLASGEQGVAVPGTVFDFQNYPVNGVMAADNMSAREPHLLWPATSQYGVHADTCSTGTIAGGVTVPKDPGTPTPTKIYLPQLQLQASSGMSGTESGYRANIKARIKTQCGSLLGDVTGTYDGATNSGTWTSPTLVTPPGEVELCVYGEYTFLWIFKRFWSIKKTQTVGTTPAELSPPASPTDVGGWSNRTTGHSSANAACA